MQVVGVGLPVLIAIVLLHMKHLGLELVVAVLGGEGAVAGGGVVESLVAAGGVIGPLGGASCSLSHPGHRHCWPG